MIVEDCIALHGVFVEYLGMTGGALRMYGICTVERVEGQAAL